MLSYRLEETSFINILTVNEKLHNTCGENCLRRGVLTEATGSEQILRIANWFSFHQTAKSAAMISALCSPYIPNDIFSKLQ